MTRTILDELAELLRGLKELDDPEMAEMGVQIEAEIMEAACRVREALGRRRQAAAES